MIIKFVGAYPFNSKVGTPYVVFFGENEKKRKDQIGSCPEHFMCPLSVLPMPLSQCIGKTFLVDSSKDEKGNFYADGIFEYNLPIAKS